jgi:hypothetical protein
MVPNEAMRKIRLIGSRNFMATNHINEYSFSPYPYTADKYQNRPGWCRDLTEGDSGT